MRLIPYKKDFVTAEDVAKYIWAVGEPTCLSDIINIFARETEKYGDTFDFGNDATAVAKGLDDEGRRFIQRASKALMTAGDAP